jgi:hypothetical protein
VPWGGDWGRGRAAPATNGRYEETAENDDEDENSKSQWRFLLFSLFSFSAVSPPLVLVLGSFPSSLPVPFPGRRRKQTPPFPGAFVVCLGLGLGYHAGVVGPYRISAICL